MLIPGEPLVDRLFAPEGDGSGGKGNGQGPQDDDDQRRLPLADQQRSDQDDDDDGEQDLEAAKERELAQLRHDSEELRKLHGKHARLIAEKKKLTTTLQRWNALGEDPEQVAARMKKEEEEQEAELRRTGDTERLVNQMKEKFERQVREKEDLVTKQQRRIEELTIDHDLKAALGAVKVDPRLMDGAYGLHRPRMRLQEDETAVSGYRVVAMFDGEDMTLGDYIKQWAEADPNAQAYILQPENRGGGAQPGRRDSGALPKKPRSLMSTKEKTEYVKKYGQEAFLALPWSVEQRRSA